MKQFVIGRKDKADLPDFKIENVLVKVDSGAYSSSIDCESVNLITINEEECLEVVFLNKNRSEYTGEKFIFKKFKCKRVKSSSGHTQNRFFISGNIVLFGKAYSTVFSLSNRSKMKTPLLIGRKLINKNFLIDTSKVNFSYNLKEK